MNGFTDGNIMQVIRLGKREEGKTRPLLDIFELVRPDRDL